MRKKQIFMVRFSFLVPSIKITDMLVAPHDGHPCFRLYPSHYPAIQDLHLLEMYAARRIYEKPQGIQSLVWARFSGDNPWGHSVGAFSRVFPWSFHILTTTIKDGITVHLMSCYIQTTNAFLKESIFSFCDTIFSSGKATPTICS